MPSELCNEFCQLDEGQSDAWTSEACYRYVPYLGETWVCQQLCIIVCHVGGVYTLIDSLVLPGGPAESEAATGS